MLYVLDSSGVALAAADWDLPGTTVGTDLGFRPYVKGCADGRTRPFLWRGDHQQAPWLLPLSYALLSAGQPRGVAAVKVSLSDSETAWAKLPGTVLLVDERGVVILSTRQEWKFRPLTELQAATRTDIAQTRPYGDASLTPIDWRESERLADDALIVRVEGVAQLASSRLVNSARWRLVVLEDLAPVRAAARNVAITSALAACVVVLLSLVGWQRRRARQAMVASQVALQAAHDTLESRVVERTTELRKAQSDLVHAEKMAALGQMSAGLVHELNQPLAAMRALSDNACVLIESRREEEAQGNLQRIGKLVDRLGKLTRQLKLFFAQVERRRDAGARGGESGDRVGAGAPGRAHSRIGCGCRGEDRAARAEGPGRRSVAGAGFRQSDGQCDRRDERRSGAPPSHRCRGAGRALRGDGQ